MLRPVEHRRIIVTSPVCACSLRQDAGFGSPQLIASGTKRAQGDSGPTRPRQAKGFALWSAPARRRFVRRDASRLGKRRHVAALQMYKLEERALRALFHLWTRRRDGSGLAQFNFFTAPGVGGEGKADRADQQAAPSAACGFTVSPCRINQPCARPPHPMQAASQAFILIPRWGDGNRSR